MYLFDKEQRAGAASEVSSLTSLHFVFFSFSDFEFSFIHFLHIVFFLANTVIHQHTGHLHKCVFTTTRKSPFNK